MKNRVKYPSALFKASFRSNLAGFLAGVLLAWFVVVSCTAELKNERFLQEGAPADGATGTYATESLGRKVAYDSPISSIALRKMAEAEEQLGHVQRAEKILALASALGWRDEPTQLALANIFLQRGMYDEAIRRLDAALRIDPGSKPLFQSLNLLIVDERFRGSLLERLRLNPEWRRDYINFNDGISRNALMSKTWMVGRLENTNMPPTSSDILPLITTLINADLPALARNVWLATIHSRSGFVYDTQFEHTSSNSGPFIWSLPTVMGATTAEQIIGKGLEVSTDGTASGVLARQMVALPPGAHVLKYTGSVPIAARPAYSWTVRCADGREVVRYGPQSDARSGTNFDIPSACVDQYVELQVKTDPSAANVSVRFDSLSIR